MLQTVETKSTEDGFFAKQNMDISNLRYLLSILLESQSSPTMSEANRYRCKSTIQSLRLAIDAIEMMVHS